jgi:hypothetical protein
MKKILKPLALHLNALSAEFSSVELNPHNEMLFTEINLSINSTILV